MYAFSEIMAGGSTFNSALKQIENEQAAEKARKAAQEKKEWEVAAEAKRRLKEHPELILSKA